VHAHMPNALFMDNAQVNKSEAIRQLCSKHGVSLRGPAPHCSESNMAERYIKTIVDMARSMLQHSGRPLWYWGWAVQAACYIRNRMSCKGNPGGVSPYEMEHGIAPDTSHLREWGATVYSHLPHDDRENARGESLDAAAEIGVLVGYAPESGRGSYRVFFPKRGKRGLVLVRRHVRFFPPSTAPRCEESDAAFRQRRQAETRNARLLKPRRTRHAPRGTADDANWRSSSPLSPVGAAPAPPPPVGAASPAVGAASPPVGAAPPPVGAASAPVGAASAPVGASPPSAPPDSLASLRVSRRGRKAAAKALRVAAHLEKRRAAQAAHASAAFSAIDTAEQRRRRDEIRLAVAKRDVLPGPELADCMADSLITPKTDADVKRSPQRVQWEAAKYVEFFGQMIGMGVLERLLDDRVPAGARPIRGKFVYKIKALPDGRILKFKARFVAQGFRQRPGLDYDVNGTYAPVSAMTTIKQVVAAACYTDMHMFQFDVTGAFLLPDIIEDVYIQYEGHVYKCHKTLYGLKQAANAWNHAMDRELKRLGFRQSKGDPCLYTRKTSEGWMYLVVWVDDVIGAGTTPAMVSDFLRDFKYPFSSSGAFEYALKINVVQEDGLIKLSQTPYIEAVAAKFGMTNANPKHTPMASDSTFSKDQMPAEGSAEHTYMQAIPYRELLGSLMYAANIRGDISGAVNTLSRFASNPGRVHWKALKRVLAYLVTTKHRPLVFGKFKQSIRPDRALHVMVDADHGGCPDTSRSTSGIYVRAFGDTIMTKSKRQGKVSNSTGAAEFHAMAHAVRKITNLRIVMADLGFPQRVVLLENDSQTAISMIQKGRLTERTKHLALAFHEVKEANDSGEIFLRHVPGVENTPDLLTKPLPRDQFQKFSRHILNDY
jgi:hypothetical protein